MSIANRSRRDQRKFAAFAEALAEGMNVQQAAASISVSHGRGSHMLATIRNDLGWQSA